MITATEDALIARIKAILGAKLRAVDSLPGDWDADMLKRLLLTAPAVYVAFAGGPPSAGADAVAGIDGRWIVFAVTANASGNAARRRGDGKVIGAYEIISNLVPRLHNHTIAGVGTLVLRNIENLYSGTIDNQGVALYAMTFGIAMNFDAEPDPADLDAFQTLHVDFDLAQKDGEIEGSTDIELEQPPPPPEP